MPSSSTGVSYDNKNSGGLRVGSDLVNLEFAADVTAPTAKRYARWNGADKALEFGVGTSDVAVTDMPAWEMFVQAKAYAKDNYMRGIKEKGGEETFHAFLSPTAMMRLKLDPTYVLNLRHAQQRDKDNPLFTGTTTKIDGIYLHEFRHVINTRLAAGGDKWGAEGAVDGCQVLFCGAQAMGMADIGDATWVEKDFDYANQPGISTGKIVGFLKPKFHTQYSGNTVEDHGVMSLYTAQ